MDLTIKEKEEFLRELRRTLPFYATVNFVQQAGRNRWPYKGILNDESEYIELQDTRCGRFGLPMKIHRDSLQVNCHSPCEDMCLSFELTNEGGMMNYSISVGVDECTTQVINIFRPVLSPLMCPNGYYRVDYTDITSENPYACFSIQIFPEPIPVTDIIESEIVDTYCNGTIMSLNPIDDMFIFLKLIEQIGLANGNICLFGLEDKITKFSDWNSIDLGELSSAHYGPYLKWDKTMNHNRILSEASYLAVNAKGEWTLVVDTVSCIVCAVNVNIQTPDLQIQYNFMERQLELEVTNQDFLYRETSSDPGFYCFALVGEMYKANLTIFPTASKYAIENVGTGQYWCSGHIIDAGNSNIRKSNVLETYGMVFAIEMERKCNATCYFRLLDDLDEFIDIFEGKYGELVRVLDSSVVDNKTTELDTEYTFVVHLILILQDNVMSNLDTTLVDLTDQRQIDTVFIYEQLNEMNVEGDVVEMNIKSIASTEYCLHKSTLSIDAIIWRVAQVDEAISMSLLCPSDQNDSIMTTKCTDDFIYGTFWEHLVNPPDCHSNISEILLDLYKNLTHSNQTSEVIEDLNAVLLESNQILLPLDVFLISRTLQKISNVTFHDINNILSIYNSVLQTDEHFLKISAIFNSTNILLKALDRHIESAVIDSIEFSIGNVSISSPLIETFVLDPKASGVSGIALYKPHNSSTSDVDFTIYSSRYIYPNETIDDVISNHSANKDLVIGSYVPSDILKILENVIVIMTVFFNDKLFQSVESPDKGYFEANGKIIAITIVGLADNTILPSEIPIFFESNRTDDSSCGYWSFMTGWSSNGCNLSRVVVYNFQRFVLCECSHLTHFGCLIYNSMHDFANSNDRTLTMITVIGSSLSLFGTLGVFVTASVFQEWRRKLSTKILIHFSASIALEMFLMIFTNIDEGLISAITDNKFACVALGSIFHYSVLVMHFWMLIIAYFQFKRYVVVFNFTVRRLLLKSTIFGWILPIVPVTMVLIIDHSLYLPLNKDELKFCYPTGRALYFGVIAPMALIFVLDFIVYVSVFVSLQRGLKTSTCMTEASKFKLRLSQIRLFVFLFFTMGLTWIFGFLSVVQPNLYLIFSYLFCIAATIQGLVLFLYFIIFDSFVRSLWLNYFRKIICGESKLA